MRSRTGKKETMLLVSVVHKSARVRYIGLCRGEMGSNVRIKTASVQRITVCVQCVCFKILFGFFSVLWIVMF